MNGFLTIMRSYEPDPIVDITVLLDNHVTSLRRDAHAMSSGHLAGYVNTTWEVDWKLTLFLLRMAHIFHAMSDDYRNTAYV